MTRDQIKHKILSILVEENVRSERPYSPYELEQILKPTSERIMKLWDQGFTYDLKKD